MKKTTKNPMVCCESVHKNHQLFEFFKNLEQGTTLAQ
jgi:hypothetical protein